MVLKATNMGTIQEMVVLGNPKYGCMARGKTVEDAADLQTRKNRDLERVDFPMYHVAISHSFFSMRKMRLALVIRRKSGKAKTETMIIPHFST